MDIENMQNQLFFERSEEFLKEFNMKKDEYEQWIFKDLEEFLEEKSTEYIVVSPLYSSFMTQTYEYRLGVYGQDLYLSNLNRSIYKELPLMKRYITEDFATIDKYILGDMQVQEFTDWQKKDIKYRYSLKYLMTGRRVWKELIESFVEHINKKNKSALDNVSIVYGLYMERGEHFFSGNIICTDESYELVPLMIDVRKSIKEEYLEEGESYKQAGISLVNIRNSFDEHDKYPDIMDRGIFMLSDEAYEIFKLYEPATVIKRVLLMEENSNEVYEYIIPILKRIDCLSDRTTFIRGRYIDKGILIGKNIPDTALFKIPNVDGMCTVARLDFVESLLKRGMKGICLQTLEIE